MLPKTWVRKVFIGSFFNFKAFLLLCTTGFDDVKHVSNIIHTSVQHWAGHISQPLYAAYYSKDLSLSQVGLMPSVCSSAKLTHFS